MAITSEQKKALEAAGYTVKGDTVMTKSGGSVGGYNENGQIWSGSAKVRGILKSSPAPKAEDKPASKPAARPAKAEDKPKPRPKANPARKPGGARPEGKASGMPAAKPKEGGKAAAAPVAAAVGARVAAARKPTKATPSNPSYTGRAAMAEGPQGRYETGIARRGGRGAGNPALMSGRIRGGRLNAVPEKPMLFMNKGGMVAKKMPKTYKK